MILGIENIVGDAPLQRLLQATLVAFHSRRISLFACNLKQAQQIINVLFGLHVRVQVEVASYCRQIVASQFINGRAQRLGIFLLLITIHALSVLQLPLAQQHQAVAAQLIGSQARPQVFRNFHRPRATQHWLLADVHMQ